MPMLRAHDVAALTDLSLGRVYSLTSAGVIPHVKVGRNVRYPRVMLEAWLRSGGTRTIDGAPL